jgi:2-keto-4-pentenoate hydratase/2-oxohepta-3-ene-1,7-dioic acid hydratase in catechol pathway
MNLIGRALIGETSCHGAIEGDRFHIITGDLFGSHRRNGQSLPLEDVTLGTPVDGVRLFNVMGGFVQPGSSRAPERTPMWLPKPTAFPTGDHGEIQYPQALTAPMQMEAELAVVIGSPLCKASPAAAHDAIYGWTVFNDLTAPEFGLGQLTPLWATAKGIDGFASWGPWIRRDLTEERVLDGLAISGYVNNQKRQSGSTRWFAFTPSEMISNISQFIRLVPGDVIALGTPYPAPDLDVGDHVVCEVEEVGTLTNYIVPDTAEVPKAWPRSKSISTGVI